MNRIETIRREMLTQLYGYRPANRDSERMAAMARREGELVDALAAEFDREGEYLQGLGYAQQRPDPVARAHKRWAITSAGIAHMEE